MVPTPARSTALAVPVGAHVTLLGSDLDEIVGRQSVAMQANLLGPSIEDPDARWSVAAHGLVGGYGTEGILGGIGAAVHTAAVPPWRLGAGVTLLEADFPTWTVAFSADRRVRDGGWLDIDVGAAAGYQHGPTGDRRFVVVRGADDRERRVLIDSLDLGHALVHVVVTVDAWILRPSLEFAWVGTLHRLDGSRWDGGLPVVAGEEDDDSGVHGGPRSGWGSGST